MDFAFSRRDLLRTAAPCVAAALASGGRSEAGVKLLPAKPGWVTGKMTGAQALVETLQAEGIECVFGIPGAQENELWDTMKAKNLGYLLVTHEFSAAAMADGYARSTGKTGVLCVVPGPGLTNSLSGLGEALLDSVPVVCIVGDVARGAKYRPFQVHELAGPDLLRPVTKEVLCVQNVREIPTLIRQAMNLAHSGEPGPVAVVVPYNLFIEVGEFHSGPWPTPMVVMDLAAFDAAVALLGNPKRRIGIYAGLGCMNYSGELAGVAEMLQAPVATSVSGKGVISDKHPLAVGWGYGPQGTVTAEQTFKEVDTVLAIGVKYSEVSTGFYAIPKHRHVIHVDANPKNLGRIVKADVCVEADAGQFLSGLLAKADCLTRPCNSRLQTTIAQLKKEECRINAHVEPVCGIDPMAFLMALRRATNSDALVFVDVSAAEHWAAEVFQTCMPRTYFNPTDNQSMGWSIPASLGGQRAFPGRQTVSITGDGCFLMSAMEISTAARECLPVKFFILDDQSYHYMQALQKPAYRRTTATILARLDYAALAQGFGVGYHEIRSGNQLDAGIQSVIAENRPMLTRIVIDYGKRRIRWIEAAKARFTDELTPAQKTRFLARLGCRTLALHDRND